MSFQQRDVVKVEAQLPDGNSAIHPFLIISCRAASNMENYYTGVMMTGNTQEDIYSFALENNMFERPLEKSNCQLRLYILVSFNENRIRSLLSRMNKVPFAEVLDRIKNYVLLIDN